MSILDFILFLTLCIILKFMFHTFGFLPDKEEKRKDEAISNFISRIDGNSIKNTVNPDKNKKNFFKNILENYESYKNKLKNLNNKTNGTNSTNNNIFNTSNETKEIKKDQTDNFEEEIFKKTAEKAVVIILDAFTRKNFLALKDMLTENMYEIFSKNIKEAEEKKYSYKTVIVSFDEVSIVDKNINHNEQSIKLKFKMKQINYIEDENKNIISGSKDKVDIITENWTFIKNPSNGFWLLKSIN